MAGFSISEGGQPGITVIILDHKVEYGFSATGQNRAVVNGSAPIRRAATRTLAEVTPRSPAHDYPHLIHR